MSTTREVRVMNPGEIQVAMAEFDDPSSLAGKIARGEASISITGHGFIVYMDDPAEAGMVFRVEFNRKKATRITDEQLFGEISWG